MIAVINSVYKEALSTNDSVTLRKNPGDNIRWNMFENVERHMVVYALGIEACVRSVTGRYVLYAAKLKEILQCERRIIDEPEQRIQSVIAKGGTEDPFDF